MHSDTCSHKYIQSHTHIHGDIQTRTYIHTHPHSNPTLTSLVCIQLMLAAQKAESKFLFPSLSNKKIER